MKNFLKLCLVYLASTHVTFAQVQSNRCITDPFAAGCLNEKAISETSAILCNDNTVIPAEQVSSASGSQDACVNNGGINAFITSGSQIQVSGNNNNSAGGSSGSSGSAGTGTGVGIDVDLDLTTTTGIDGFIFDVLPLDTDGSFVIIDDGINDGGITSSGTTSSGTTSSGTTSSGTTSSGNGASCNSTCDCSESYEACIGGTCQNINSYCSESAFNGLVKGDSTCQWSCSCSAGGSVMCQCPANVGPCGGDTTTGGIGDGGFIDGGADGGTTDGGTTDGGTTTDGGSPGCLPDGQQCYDQTRCGLGISTCAQCCNPPVGPQYCTGPDEASTGTCGGDWDQASGNQCLMCQQ